MTRLGYQNFWKIGYHDAAGAQRAIRILPKKWNGEFNKFQQLVRAANPQVKIKSWSHSFDFDQ